MRYFFLFLLSLPVLVSFSREKKYTDSIITYQILGSDTTHPMPFSLETFTYEEDKLNEKNQYGWDRESKGWKLKFKWKIHHYTKEIKADCFFIENQKNEILFKRIIGIIDDQKHFTEITVYDKDRYKEKYNRLQQFFFTYKNDTLLTLDEFKQKTIFFKHKSTNYKYTSKTIAETVKYYNEDNSSAKTENTTLQVDSGKIIRKVYTEVSAPSRVDSFYYKGNLLEAIVNKAYGIPSKDEKTNFEYLTLYSYDVNESLREKYYLKMHNNLIVQSASNYKISYKFSSDFGLYEPFKPVFLFINLLK